MVSKLTVKVTLPQGCTRDKFEKLLEKISESAAISIYVNTTTPYAFLTMPRNQFMKFKKIVASKYDKLVVERSNDMAQLIVKNIPTGTNKQKFEEMMEEFDTTVLHFKYSKPNPYAFTLVEKKKAESIKKSIAAKHAELEVEVAAKYGKYFLDTRTTKGALNEIPEESLKSYFETYGEVVSLNVVPSKSIGFVTIKVDDDTDTTQLAEMEHDIDGHEVAVTVEKKRKQNWKGGRNKRRKLF